MGINATGLFASINNGPHVAATLTVETEQIDVTPMSKTKPDLRWEYADPSGHFHAFDRDGELPSLISRSRDTDCDGSCGGVCDGEGYTITEYFCVICDAPVEPVWITTPSVFREFIPGRTSWTVEVEARVTDEKVSVRLVSGAPLDEFEAFGMAARGAFRAEGGPDGMRVWTTLHGMTPLGYRKVDRAMAPSS